MGSSQVDSTPTLDSDNLITSGGVKRSLSGYYVEKHAYVDKIIHANSGQSSITLSFSPISHANIIIYFHIYRISGGRLFNKITYTYYVYDSNIDAHGTTITKNFIDFTRIYDVLSFSCAYNNTCYANYADVNVTLTLGADSSIDTTYRFEYWY